VKLNNVQDPTLIAELYKASQAGVKIDMILRSVCCLRPGMKGVSENLRCISIIDRFLEHARCFYFHNDGQGEYYLASADWMNRNLDRRIELIFPIMDKSLHKHIWGFLQMQIHDNAKARIIKPDGTSEKIQPPKGAVRLRSQERMIEASLDLAKTGQWGSMKIEGVTEPKAETKPPLPAQGAAN
jgi:polyphosphate kinase